MRPLNDGRPFLATLEVMAHHRASLLRPASEQNVFNAQEYLAIESVRLNDFLFYRQYCFRASVQCTTCSSSTLTNTAMSFANQCDIINYITASGKGPACSAADIAAGNYVQAYWTSDTKTNLGIELGDSAVRDVLCCDTDGCNKPGAGFQAKCLTYTSTFASTSYCAGQTLKINTCLPTRMSLSDYQGMATNVSGFLIQDCIS
jgi:hypothetical protein